MKYLTVPAIIALSVLGAFAFSVKELNYDAVPVTDHDFRYPGVAAYNTAGNYPMGNNRCMVTNHLITLTSYLNLHKDELKLTMFQLDELSRIKEDYEQEASNLNVELSTNESKIDNILSGDDISLIELNKVNTKIAELEKKLQDRNITAFVDAKNLLTSEQLKKAKDLGIFNFPESYCYSGRIR